MSQFTRGYALSLSDGRSWWIASDGDNIRYADKMAAIMELEESTPNGSSKLIFSSAGNTDDAKNELSNLELSGSSQRNLRGRWTAYDYKTIRIWHHNRIDDVICEIKDSSREYLNIWYSSQAIFLQSVKLGGLPIHSALLELNGRGILLCAPSGTGKSTCCSRLPEYWKPLCDDETLIVSDGEKQYRAQPFPTWSEYLLEPSGNTWNVQHSVPISGVFFLEQFESDEVIPLGAGQTAAFISESVDHVFQKFWRGMNSNIQKNIRRQFFDNACKMAMSIPGFYLRASLCGKFWEEIEKACK